MSLRKRKRTNDQEYWRLYDQEIDQEEEYKEPKLKIKFQPGNRLKRAKIRNEVKRAEEKRLQKLDNGMLEFEKALKTNSFPKVLAVAKRVVKIIQTSRERRDAQDVFWKSGTRLSDDMSCESKILDCFIDEDLDPKILKDRRVWSLTMVQLVRRDPFFQMIEESSFLWSPERAKILFSILPIVQDREYFLTQLLWTTSLKRNLFFTAFLMQVSTKTLHDLLLPCSMVWMEKEQLSMFVDFLNHQVWTDIPLIINQLFKFIRPSTFEINYFTDPRLKKLRWPMATMFSSDNNRQEFYSARNSYQLVPRPIMTFCKFCLAPIDHRNNRNNVQILVHKDIYLPYEWEYTQFHHCCGEIGHILFFEMKGDIDERVTSMIRCLKKYQKFDPCTNLDSTFQDLVTYCKNMDEKRELLGWEFVLEENLQVSEMTRDRKFVADLITSSFIEIGALSNIILDYTVSIPNVFITSI